MVCYQGGFSVFEPLFHAMFKSIQGPKPGIISSQTCHVTYFWSLWQSWICGFMMRSFRIFVQIQAIQITCLGKDGYLMSFKCFFLLCSSCFGPRPSAFSATARAAWSQKQHIKPCMDVNSKASTGSTSTSCGSGPASARLAWP